MIAVFDKPETSKELYFRLNNAFQLGDVQLSPAYKVAGLYAIYKNDICHYIGQSGNLASRLSTHLTGKYESADRVDLFYLSGFDDFYERTKKTQKTILENNETRLMQLLKPIENIVFDMDKNIAIEHLFTSIADNTGDLFPDLSIYISKFNFTVLSDATLSIDEVDSRVVDLWKEYDRYMYNVAKGIPC